MARRDDDDDDDTPPPYRDQHEHVGCGCPLDPDRDSAAEVLEWKIEQLKRTLADMRQLHKLAEPLERDSPAEVAMYQLVMRGLFGG